jgi:hypothetical protein
MAIVYADPTARKGRCHHPRTRIEPGSKVVGRGEAGSSLGLRVTADPAAPVSRVPATTTATIDHER